MKIIAPLLLSVLLAGCFETAPRMPDVQFVPPQVNIDARLLQGCPRELPQLRSGEEADVVLNYAEVTAVYARCADNNNGLIEVLQRVVGEYARAVQKYVDDVKSAVEGKPAAP